MKSSSEFQSTERTWLFPRLSSQAVESWSMHGETIEVNDGTCVLEEGSPLYPFLVVLSGRVQVVKRLGNQEIVLAVHETFDFVGEITILAGCPCPATAIARGPTRLISVPGDIFRSLVVKRDREAAEVVKALALRSAEIGAIGRHQEKLASLGRIAAGLAHELNNPAAAISSRAATLRAELIRNQTIVLALTGGYDPSEQKSIVAILEQRNPVTERDSVWIQDNADELESWLSANGVQAAALYAPNLSEFGYTATTLASSLMFLENRCQRALEWLANTLILISASTSIETSSRRISDILERMKHYSHLDQAPLLEIDLHRELDATLSMLDSRLAYIAVERVYCPTLPPLSVFASEMNQVWTNLIENAVDAMPEGGRLQISTACDDRYVTVQIADTGSGIKPEIQNNVFDPFFTTKDVGQGYGLGLDYVYRTVVRRHAGQIQFASQPGDTRFLVQLPLNVAPA